MFLEHELPKNWVLLSKNESHAMEVELAREVCVSHPLFGKPVNAIARKVGSDDFVYSVKTDDKKLYVVHLTWDQETIPDWPSIKIFANKICFMDSLVTSD